MRGKERLSAPGKSLDFDQALERWQLGALDPSLPRAGTSKELAGQGVGGTGVGGTSMIGNSQGETEIPLDLAEGVLPTGKA